MTLPDAPPPYAGVVFDCDSTLSSIEGIDELARLVGRHEAELRELTSQAMGGQLPLEAVYARRLELVQPTRADVEAVGKLYVETALENAGALVAALRALDKKIHIVSGGLRPAVSILAEHLGLADDHVHAVELEFDHDGSYRSCDPDSPLARAGGKVEVIAGLCASIDGPLALVGDGVTDLEAGHLAARFVAFGGVERREAVFRDASCHLTDPDLASLAPLLLGEEELERLHQLPQHSALVEAARAAR